MPQPATRVVQRLADALAGSMQWLVVSNRVVIVTVVVALNYYCSALGFRISGDCM